MCALRLRTKNETITTQARHSCITLDPPTHGCCSYLYCKAPVSLPPSPSSSLPSLPPSTHLPHGISPPQVNHAIIHPLAIHIKVSHQIKRRGVAKTHIKLFAPRRLTPQPMLRATESREGERERG